MHDLPPTPTAADAPDSLFERGHLWVIEAVEGTPLRFALDSSGLLRFAGPDRAYADPDDVPARLRAAVRHVREHLDRDALRDAVDDVAGVTFAGVATHRRRVDYDWRRLPPFLGVDVWSDATDAFRPPDAANGIFDALGLAPANALAREVRARDFDVAGYAMPASAWYDGPVAGVLVRNKRGERATIPNPDLGGDPVAAGQPDPPVGADPADAVGLAADYASTARFERVADEIAVSGREAAFDALVERVTEGVAREAPAQFDAVDADRFRADLVERTRRFLDERA